MAGYRERDKMKCTSAKKRNLLIRVDDVAFFAANNNDVWYMCHVYVADSAPDAYEPQVEVGGWDRDLTGRLHPLEVWFEYPLPERFHIDAEKAVRREIAKAYEALLKALNPG
jgi:hypothetical protein